MGSADYFALGDWNARCSMCGAKRKASQLVKNWQGMYRCPQHNEPRHPQDFVRAVPDTQTPPWVQAINEDRFIGVTAVEVCTLNDQSAIPNYAEPGCVKPGYIAVGNTIF